MDIPKEAFVLADYYTRRALEVNRIEGEISSAEASIEKMYDILGMPFERAGYTSSVPNPVSLEELLSDEESLRSRISQINDAYDNAVKTRERQQKVLAEAESKVKEVARLDGLTHLYRKDVFLALLDKEIQRKNSPHRRTEDAEGILGLIIMDIDNFKLYNDSYGYTQGDVAIRSVAEVVNHQVRGENDLIARTKGYYGEGGRFGGEELMVFVHCSTAEDLGSIAERLRQAVYNNGLDTSAKLDKSGNAYEAYYHGVDGRKAEKVSVSVGCAVYQDGMVNKNLIKSANQALKEAKKKRNCTVCAWEMPKDSQE